MFHSTTLISRTSVALFAMAGLCLVAGLPSRAAADSDVSADAVIKHYADIGEAVFGDTHQEALKLQAAVDALVAAPSAQTLDAARKAWVAARVPYMQTEAFRFGNPIVDDWEGKVNAWPLDEGLIDYVADAYGTESPENELYVANVIANKTIMIGGKSIDASTITPEFLAETLHEGGDVEANVATGYHAIEFLLWGQDLNGTGPGAGARPATDFDTKACTGGNCDRRVAYLVAATNLLVDDLAFMADQWKADGAARKAVQKDANQGLTAIFTGLGSLSYGELAGERMKLGLIVHDPEEEHDCFSDNTPASHYGDALGIQNVYLGTYTRTDGRVLKGPSVSDLVKAKAPETDQRVRASLSSTMAKMSAMVDRWKTKEAYDQMIGQGNADGNAVVQAVVDALVAQAKDFERAIASLDLKDIKFEGSDSLDSPGKVDQ